MSAEYPDSRKKKTRNLWRGLGWLLFGLVAAPALLFVGVSLWLIWLWASTPEPYRLLTEVRSPTGMGSVALVTENISFAGSTAWVYVRDPEGTQGRPLLLGVWASDAKPKMGDVVWSRDGSVVAARIDVGTGGGKNFEKYFGRFATTAYDFRTNRIVPVDRAGPMESVRSRSRAIEKLIQQRGGPGRVLFPTPYDASGKTMSRRQLNEFGIFRE